MIRNISHIKLLVAVVGAAAVSGSDSVVAEQ
jgi:hypothetical protein